MKSINTNTNNSIGEVQGAPGGGGDKPAFWQAVLDLDEGERLDDFNAMP